MSPLRVVFAGTPDFAASSLAALLDSEHEVVAVYTQPDRPAGRGRKLTPSPVKQLAQAQALPVYQPVSLKDAEAQAELAALNADVMVVVAYGLLLPQAVLDTPRLGCINVHASLLPRWRGAAPIQRAIEAGDSASGVTIMQMDVGLDTGDMLYKLACPITAEDTSGTLYDKLANLGPQGLIETLKQLAAGTAKPVVQDEALVTHAQKLSKEEARINWNESAAVIERKIRAFNPVPAAWVEYQGKPMKIWRAEVVAQQGRAGEVLSCSADGLVVACGENALKITELQPSGSKRMPIAAFAAGHKIEVGTVL